MEKKEWNEKTISEGLSRGFFYLNELPFGVSSAYRLEKAGKLVITRPHGAKGMSFVRIEDLEQHLNIKLGRS